MAGKIEQHFIDDLLARTDLVEVVQRFVPLKKSGQEFTACCPFHAEKTPSFHVSPRKQFYYCFGCGASGNAIGFLIAHEHISFPEAIEQLAEWEGMIVPREATATTPFNDQQAVLFTILNHCEQLYREQLRASPTAITYLKNRGISGKIAKHFALGWAPAQGQWLLSQLRRQYEIELLIAAGVIVKRDDGQLSDRFRGRILFPIRDRRGRTTGFGGRLVAPGEPKYLNSPESTIFHKSQTIYGLYEARQSEPGMQELVVTEGYMDVVSLAETGYPRAVACMGTALTQEHLRLLFRQVSRLTICFDGDTAGRRAARRAMESILPYAGGTREIRILFLPENDDPDTLVRREGLTGWTTRLQEALRLSEALIKLLEEQHDLATVEGRSHFTHAAISWIKRVEDPVYRTQLIGQIADKTHTSPNHFETLLSQPESPQHSRKKASPKEEEPHNLDSLWVALLARILQYPHLQWQDPLIEEVSLSEGPGPRLLSSLMAYLHEHPETSTGRLLEQFRQGPDFNTLQALLTVSVPEQEESLCLQVGLDSARQIQREIHRRKFLALTQKISQATTEEISELRRLQSRLNDL